jgi:hypothetical protein
MFNSSISINAGHEIDYSKIVGRKLSYTNAEAEMHATKDGIKIDFVADDAKSLLSSMGSVIKQLTIVENTLAIAEKLEKSAPHKTEKRAVK